MLGAVWDIVAVRSDRTCVRRGSDNVVKIVQSVAWTLCQLYLLRYPKQIPSIVRTTALEIRPSLQPTSEFVNPKCLSHRSLDDWRII
jgi:hypothetical protein